MSGRWLAAAAFGFAALIGAFFFGRDVGIDSEKAKQLDVVEAAAKRERALQVELDTLRRDGAARESQRQEHVREIYREVPQIIERPVYRDICIDGDGVRLLERSIDAANGKGGPGAAAAAAGVPGAGDNNRP